MDSTSRFSNLYVILTIIEVNKLLPGNIEYILGNFAED